MQIFISWSGKRSKAVAELLDDWIQCVLQAARPWMSSKDIERGSLWFSEMTDQLKDTKIGIICLTKGNLNNPWILFESGALAKGLSSSRVCTFLIDLETKDVGNPLAQFNHTFPNKEGIYDLLRTLNASLGNHALKDNVLEQVYETYWPKFEDGFIKALNDNPVEEIVEIRSEQNILAEMLDILRSFQQRARNNEPSAPNGRPWTIRNVTTGQLHIDRELHSDISKLYVAGISKDFIARIYSDKIPANTTYEILDKLKNNLNDDENSLETKNS